MAAADRDDDTDQEQDLPGPEEDVVVILKLGNRRMGTAAERSAIESLCEQLEAAVERAGAGEFDGDELGGGECSLFFTGPDARRLFAVLQPLLHRHPMGRGARLRLQDASGTVEEHSA